MNIGICVLLSILLLMGAHGLLFQLPTTPLEVWIFLTGAAAVWLAVKEHVWNWPVGLVNVALWTVMFMQQRLYANVGLQAVYVISGLLGWWWWTQKSDGEAKLKIADASRPFQIGLWALCLALSYPAQLFLISIGGAATYWDGLTTLLSLAGQYLLMKKLRQTWYFWIVADVVYVALFISQKLYLSAGLYSILLVMCIVGIRDWRQQDAV